MIKAFHPVKDTFPVYQFLTADEKAGLLNRKPFAVPIVGVNRYLSGLLSSVLALRRLICQAFLPCLHFFADEYFKSGNPRLGNFSTQIRGCTSLFMAVPEVLQQCYILEVQTHLFRASRFLLAGYISASISQAQSRLYGIQLHSDRFRYIFNLSHGVADRSPLWHVIFKNQAVDILLRCLWYSASWIISRYTAE